MEEQTPAPKPVESPKRKIDSHMSILIVLTVALVFAWVFYFYYIYQTQEVDFSVTIKSKDTTIEVNEIDETAGEIEDETVVVEEVTE